MRLKGHFPIIKDTNNSPIPSQHSYLNFFLSRNLFILGFSLFLGLTVPIWVRANSSSINTGVEELDQIFIVLLETSIFVGGVVAAFFDNTLPGKFHFR